MCQEFSQLLKDLDDATFRSAFCARGSNERDQRPQRPVKSDWVGKKIDLKAEKKVRVRQF